jgi:hypothetical protein
MIDCPMCGWTYPAGGAPVCPHCADVSAREIAALALDFRDLGRIIPGDNGPGLRISGTHTPAVPIDLSADEVRSDIVWTLGVWEPPVREAAGLDPAPELRIRPGRLVARAASLLSTRLSDFLTLGDTWGYPDGLEAGCVARSGLYGVLSCRRLHGRARHLLGLTAPRTRLPGACDRCGATAYTRDDGDDDVRCGHCATVITGDEYRAYVGFTLTALHHPSG